MSVQSGATAPSTAPAPAEKSIDWPFAIAWLFALVFYFIVIAMYATVLVEDNFITPFVQAEATALPPVLSLLSIVAFGLLLGPASVLIAAPLTLFLMVVVELLYASEV